MKNDRISTRGRAPLLSGMIALSGIVLLSGCMGSPTYGTGKSANQQLLEDIGGSLSLGSPNRSGEIAYRPRPELVRPASLDVLPEPQQELATAENPAWPESPEQRRARIRAEATENQDNPRYRASVVSSSGTGVRSAAMSDNRGGVPDANHGASQRAELQRRTRENRQGSPTSRRYLSEPPIEYRVPADTAEVGDLGEDERTKERRLRQAAGGRSSWRDYVPWL